MYNTCTNICFKHVHGGHSSAVMVVENMRTYRMYTRSWRLRKYPTGPSNIYKIDDFRRSRKNTSKILKSTKPRIPEVTNTYTKSKYMVAAFGRSQKRAAAFGRCPLLSPYLDQKRINLIPGRPFANYLKDFSLF